MINSSIISREAIAESYDAIEFDKPFYILSKGGKLKDITVWRKDKEQYGGSMLRMYFHVEGFWINPPIDTNMAYNAQKKIARYGVAYLPDGYVEGYTKIPIGERSKYIQGFVAKVEARL